MHTHCSGVLAKHKTLYLMCMATDTHLAWDAWWVWFVVRWLSGFRVCLEGVGGLE
jgi:hypothetical protein